MSKKSAHLNWVGNCSKKSPHNLSPGIITVKMLLKHILRQETISNDYQDLHFLLVSLSD